MDEFVSFEKDDKMLSTCSEIILHKGRKIYVIRCRIQKKAGFITIKDEPSVNRYTIRCMDQKLTKLRFSGKIILALSLFALIQFFRSIIYSVCSFQKIADIF